MSPSGYQYVVQNPAAFGSQFSNPNPNNSLDYSNYNGDWYGYLTALANSGDQAAIDKLLNYLMTEHSNQIARDWTAQREDTAYQRLVEDMKKAGLNPYALATMGGSPIASSSSGSSYSGSYNSSYEIKKAELELSKEKNQQQWLKIILSGVLPVVGAVIAAML